MTVFFSFTLGISIVGLVTLLALKRYETTTNRVVLGSVRPVLGRFFHLALLFVERGVPGAARTLIVRVVHAARTYAQQALAHAMLFFEHNLERALHLMRQKSQAPQGEGVASQFLQEVAAHKQKLLRRSSSKRIILDK